MDHDRSMSRSKVDYIFVEQTEIAIAKRTRVDEEGSSDISNGHTTIYHLGAGQV